jgi:Ca2+:H+ antiporter
LDMKKLWLGLAGVVVSLVAHLAGAETLTFIASVLAIIPLAGLIGTATEELAIHTGPRLGGLLNATFGNATELVIATLLIFGGEQEVVKASITGSVIGNCLAVLGLAFLLGGLRFKEQEFNAKVAGMHSASLVLALFGLLIPALYHQASPQAGFVPDETVSTGVALVLITLYISSLVFSFVTHRELPIAVHGPEIAKWSKRRAMVLLATATALVAYGSELLVESLEVASESLGISKFFIGLILVPIVGNAAEHMSAVFLAMKNKVDTAIEIAVGSSTQIALFVAPLLVIISLLVGHPMDFFFTGFEIAVVGLSSAIVALIALDGRSNWLEGAQLVAAYVIVGLSALFL